VPGTATAPEGASVPDAHPDAPPPGTPLPSHYSDCYGCGPAHPTGLHMEMRAEEGIAISAEFTVTEDHQGAPGLAHGGLLAAAFDEALGGLMHRLRRPAVTVRLETDFRLPVPVGSRLVISARCTGVDGRKVYGEAEGRLGPDGPVAVRASSLFLVVPLEHFTTHGSRRPDVPPARDTSYNP
jgi:acyl-coenzyme A thioesterase PaaI-like protein